ncbi:hypothetical protein [Acinetobacter sp. ANC 4173]|uniref:hypothetical protein n=1 Tax=Acinetobacter sp. ANC 4173 TaxID=2529837 RepID=UPI00103EC350|nr:hypothetical protein [Acinetobacter sp. ANC 4173]TCB78803.1 hypothetical protein E0H94_11555 [Acinetobacter sp. ANC 4173]
MALDQIWKQQLTLVTYGNEFLNKELSFNRWKQHPIFDQHLFVFRDLISQHLLAQHFQIWLEGLKKQGTKRLSLHSSNLLNDEQNPNTNVELLPFAHFIVSHEANKKIAWIFGKELAEWYNADNDFEVPATQQNPLRHETFWRFELNSKLAKRIDADLQPPNWDDIQSYTQTELFNSPLIQGFVEPTQSNLPYFGYVAKTNTENELDPQKLALIPTDYAADFAHKSLYRLEALNYYIQNKLQHPQHEDGSLLSADEQLNLRHFSQKLEDLQAKFIVKVANHYQTAQLTSIAVNNPLEGAAVTTATSTPSTSHHPHKIGSSAVFKLILITVIICIVAYYFGL